MTSMYERPASMYERPRRVSRPGMVLLAVSCIASGVCGAQSSPDMAAAPAMPPEIQRALSALPKTRRENLLTSVGTLPGPDFTLLFDKQVADIRMCFNDTVPTEIYTP